MRFYYRAHTDEGEEKSGVIEAPSRLLALKRLATDGLHVDYCETHPERRVLEREEVTDETRTFADLLIVRPSPGRMAGFYNQLGNLLAAGVSPHEAAQALADRAPGRQLRTAMADIAPRLAAGSSLADELARYPQLFPPEAVGLFRAAERSGDFPGACRELEEWYQQLHKGLLWFQSARIYYGFVLLLVVLIPSFPWIVARGFRWYLYFALTRLLPIIAALATGWVGMRMLFGLPGFRPIRDRFVLALPLLGWLERRAAAARFLRALGALLRAGVALPDAVETAADALGNVYLRSGALRAAADLRGGAELDQALRKITALSADERNSLLTAMQSGRMDEGIAHLAEQARTVRGQGIGAMRLAGVIGLGAAMAVVVAVAVIAAWLNFYAASAERLGISDIWQELLNK